MSTRDVDRLLTTWLAADAPAREPDHLLEMVLARTSQTRRRPGWLISERWLSLDLTMRRVQLPGGVVPAVVLVALLLATIVGLALVGTPRRLPPLTGPAANGSIVFVSAGQLWATGPTGSAPRALTSDEQVKGVPTFSHLGTRIAYLTFAPGVPAVLPAPTRASLVVADADGSDPRTVVSDVETIRYVDWAHDDRTLAFSYWDEIDTGQRDRVFVAPADGSTPPRRIGDPDLSAFYPAFSPDGRLIAFVSDLSPFHCTPEDCRAEWTYALHVMASDGSGVRPLVKGSVQPVVSGMDRWVRTIDWSPDGTRLLFTGLSVDAPLVTGVYLVDVLGGAPARRIDGSTGQAFGGSWSPSGDHVAFVRGTPGAWEAVVVNPEGSDARVVARDLSRFEPRWSPDGRSIAVLDEYETAEGRIRIVPLDGGDELVIPFTIADPARADAPGIDAITWQRSGD